MVNEQVLMCIRMIEEACVQCGLNLTVYDGKIAFVDQEQWKIVAVWNPKYTKNGRVDE